MERSYPFILLSLLHLNTRDFVSLSCMAGFGEKHMEGKGDPGRSTRHAKVNFVKVVSLDELSLGLEKSIIIHLLVFVGKEMI